MNQTEDNESAGVLILLTSPINRHYCIVVLDIKDNILLVFKVLVIEETNQSFVDRFWMFHDHQD